MLLCSDEAKDAWDTSATACQRKRLMKVKLNINKLRANFSGRCARRLWPKAASAGRVSGCRVYGVVCWARVDMMGMRGVEEKERTRAMCVSMI